MYLVCFPYQWSLLNTASSSGFGYKKVNSLPWQRWGNWLNNHGLFESFWLGSATAPGILNTWLAQWLTYRSQTVVVVGYNSPEVPVLSGVPQETVLGPLLFLLYINDLGENCTSRMRLFADDTLIYSTIESYNDAAKLQSDLTAIQEWAQKWQMKFNPSKRLLSLTMPLWEKF